MDGRKAWAQQGEWTAMVMGTVNNQQSTKNMTYCVFRVPSRQCQEDEPRNTQYATRISESAWFTGFPVSRFSGLLVDNPHETPFSFLEHAAAGAGRWLELRVLHHLAIQAHAAALDIPLGLAAAGGETRPVE